MIANQIAGLLTGGVAASLTDYESIQTYSISTATSSVTFSSIPSTYTHLQIRWIGQHSSNVVDTSMAVQFNADTGSNYSVHRLYGDGASAAAAAATSTTFMRADRLNAPSGASSIFGAGIIDILDYKDTNKYKTMRSLGGVDRNGSGQIFFNSGSWRNTAAITSITLYGADTGNFNQYSSFALYGIK
jgi:hypothetical protein